MTQLADKQVTMRCVVNTPESRGQCDERITVPAYEDLVTKELKPVQVHPYICLGCWRAGWRHDNMIGGRVWRE